MLSRLKLLTCSARRQLKELTQLFKRWRHSILLSLLKLEDKSKMSSENICWRDKSVHLYVYGGRKVDSAIFPLHCSKRRTELFSSCSSFLFVPVYLFHICNILLCLFKTDFPERDCSTRFSASVSFFINQINSYIFRFCQVIHDFELTDESSENFWQLALVFKGKLILRLINSTIHVLTIRLMF